MINVFYQFLFPKPHFRSEEPVCDPWVGRDLPEQLTKLFSFFSLFFNLPLGLFHPINKRYSWRQPGLLSPLSIVVELQLSRSYFKESDIVHVTYAHLFRAEQARIVGLKRQGQLCGKESCHIVNLPLCAPFLCTTGEMLYLEK